MHPQPPASPTETRALQCPDGVTRIVPLAPWYWERLDILLAVDQPSLTDITTFCQKLAKDAVTNEGWSMDHAFRELLMYYIYRNYFGYTQIQGNVANEFWDAV